MKNRKKNVFVGTFNILFCSSIILFGFLAIIANITPDSASALTYQDSVNVQFTFNPTLSINLSSADLMIPNLAPGTSSDSNVITVGVSTNAPFGYSLSATVGTKNGTSSLNNTTDSTYKFNNLASAVGALASIPENNWGYSYSSDDGTTWVNGDTGSATAGYGGLPLDNNTNADERGKGGVLLLDNNGSSSAPTSVKFKIGANASTTQPSGDYTNVINFYAVATAEPPTLADAFRAAGKTMVNGYYALQDMEESICSNAWAYGEPIELRDTRDNQIYKIAKLKDNNCWMLDNLALDLTDSTVLNGMNATNTNASNTTLAYLKGTTSRDPNNDPDGNYATSGAISWQFDDSFSQPESSVADKDTIPQGDDTMASEVLAGGWKTGGFYNFCAATAGSYCYGNGSSGGTSTGNATEDICPAGWRLPTGDASGEYSTLYALSDYNSYTALRTALHLPLSGYLRYSSVSSLGTNGGWWSSSRNDDELMYRLYTNNTKVFPAIFYNRARGSSIRCIADI